MITKLLTSLVTRDVEAFVAFVEHFRDKLDALVIRHISDIGKVQTYIDEIKAEAEDRVAKIKAEAEAAIQDAQDYANSEVTAAETEIEKLKAKLDRVQAAATAVSKI